MEISCAFQVLEDSEVKKVLSWRMTFGANSSVLEQLIILGVSSDMLVLETSVDWKEAHKLLKVHPQSTSTK